VGLDAAAPDDMAAAGRRLRASASPAQTVVMLRHADIANTRALSHAGAADVLFAPAGEAALALCLERLLARETAKRGPAGKSGQMVALLKAGGGVGATALGVQLTTILAERAGQPDRICFADLDLQFGSAALYFDLAEALTITDCLAVGEFLQDTQFATALAAHKSGARVLAGPRDLTTLDALTPALADALVGGLRRDFTLTIVDLPSVWTAWTNRVLQLADRIVLVTALSVPHVHLVRRQLQVLSLQKLDTLPLTLVCNAVTSEQQSMLSLKAAEHAIGRPFDIVVPDDSRIMGTAINEGLTLSAVRRGTKLERAVGLVADAVAADALTGATAMRSR
jgi:pilus assembly protein CpaE